MKRFTALFLQALGALTLLGLVLAAALLLTAGWWLRMDDELKKADAIVILAGDVRRAIHAADLYNQGLAPVIYLGRTSMTDTDALCDLGFPCPTQEESMRQVLRAKGVPQEVLQLYGQEHISTVQEAESMGHEFGPELKTLIVVTSAFHCRRAKLILDSQLKGRELIMSPTPYVRFDVKWWEHQTSASAVATEVAKFVLYFLGTPFRSRPLAAQ